MSRARRIRHIRLHIRLYIHRIHRLCVILFFMRNLHTHGHANDDPHRPPLNCSASMHKERERQQHELGHHKPRELHYPESLMEGDLILQVIKCERVRHHVRTADDFDHATYIGPERLPPHSDL